MDNDLKALLEELNKLAEPSQEQPKQETEQQPQYKQESTQEESEEIRQRLQVYRDLGLQRFITLNASMPDFNKLFPLIVQYADTYLYNDIQAGKVKDDYIDYLNEAKAQVIRELANLTKNVISYTTSTPQTQSQPTAKQPTYSVKDYYNDYKKMLIKATVEETPIEFRDGFDTGKGLVSIASGTLPLDQKAKLDEI